MADYPTTNYKGLKITSDHAVEQFKSESGKMQARLIGGQKFMVSITHPPLTKDEYFPIDAFIMGLNGSDETCTLQLPTGVHDLGAVSGSPVTNGARSAGSNSIAIDGITAGLASAYVAGDLINLSNHDKSYNIVSTVNSYPNDYLEKADSSGVLLLNTGDKILMTRANQANVTIFPPLIENVSDNIVVKHGSAYRMTVKTTDSQDYKVQPPNIYQKAVKFIEYIA